MSDKKKTKKDQNIHDLQHMCNSVLKKDSPIFLKRDNWGSINFFEIKEEIELLFKLVEHLNSLPFKNLPSSDIRDIFLSLNQVNGHLNKILKFQIDLPNVENQRQGIIEAFNKSFEDFYKQIRFWMPILIIYSNSFGNELEKIRTITSESEDLLDKSKNYFSELETIIRTSKEVALQKAVGRFNENFYNKAESLKKKADTWFAITITLASTTFLFMVVLATASLGVIALEHFGLINETIGQQLQKYSAEFIFIRVGLIAFWITITAWAAKMYKTLMHQSEVNEHRALSLQTFQAFAQATDSQQIKDQVLLEATRTIFGNVPTGYIKESSKSDATIRVLDAATKIGKA